jgi:predicted DNA repair protein MutK
MTVGVYGLVAGIVKLDDLGLHLTRRVSRAAQTVGRLLLRTAPLLMKALAVVGTAAMFMVGGGILTHGIPAVHHLIASAAAAIGGVPAVGGVLAWLTPILLDAVFGIAAGAVVLALVAGLKRLLRRGPPAAQR